MRGDARPARPAGTRSPPGPVDVTPVFDPEHHDLRRQLDESVQDAVRPTPGRPDAGELSAQGLTDPAWLLNQSRRQEVDHGRCYRLGQPGGQARRAGAVRTSSYSPSPVTASDPGLRPPRARGRHGRRSRPPPGCPPAPPGPPAPIHGSARQGAGCSYSGVGGLHASDRERVQRAGHPQTRLRQGPAGSVRVAAGLVRGRAGGRPDRRRAVEPAGDSVHRRYRRVRVDAAELSRRCATADPQMPPGSVQTGVERWRTSRASRAGHSWAG